MLSNTSKKKSPHATGWGDAVLVRARAFSIDCKDKCGISAENESLKTAKFLARNGSLLRMQYWSCISAERRKIEKASLAPKEREREMD